MALIIDDFFIGLIRGMIAFLSLVAQIAAGIIALATRDLQSMVVTIMALLVFLYLLWWAPTHLPDSWYMVPIK